MTELVKKELDRIAGIKNRNPEDYEKGGILFCGKCHEAKQAWIDWLPDENGNPQRKLVPVMCRCAVEEERQEKQRKADERFIESLRHYVIAIHGQQRPVSVKTFRDDDGDSSIRRACMRYVDRWEEMKADNMGILFYGSKGTGKTFYASCICEALKEKKVPAVMTTTANLMIRLSAWDKDEIMDALVRVPMLGLDDLGAERDTSYAAELMYSVIDARYKAQKPVIVTTNMDLAEMQEETDIWRSRIYDRVIEMCPITIKMDGASRRAGIADERKRKAREMLREVRP